MMSNKYWPHVCPIANIMIDGVFALKVKSANWHSFFRQLASIVTQRMSCAINRTFYGKSAELFRHFSLYILNDHKLTFLFNIMQSRWDVYVIGCSTFAEKDRQIIIAKQSTRPISRHFPHRLRKHHLLCEQLLEYIYFS
jgi:hypothetical protein